MSDLSTAHHEAGHAAMCLWLGTTFESASIIGDEESDGRVIGSSPSHFRPDLSWDWRYQAYIEAEIQVLLAGAEVERRHTGTYDHQGASGDFSRALSYAALVHCDETAMNAFLAWLDAATKETCDNDRFMEMTEQLADALLEHRTMSYRTARHLAGRDAAPVRRWRFPPVLLPP